MIKIIALALAAFLVWFVIGFLAAVAIGKTIHLRDRGHQ